MSALPALAPLGLALLLILGFRLDPILGGLAGLAAAFAIAAFEPEAILAGPALGLAVETALVIGFSAASVILPGLILNHVLGRRGGLDRLAAGLSTTGLEPARLALILLFGLFPALESLTGFGISLLLSVPVLGGLLGPATGTCIALLGMVVMSWGTLALATLVGAALAGMAPELLAMVTAALQAPALVVTSLIALGAIGGRAALRRHAAFGALMALLLAVFLHLNSRWLLVETAGALAGIAAALLGLGWEAARGRLRPAAGLAWAAGLAPFGAALAILLAMRLLPPLAALLGDTLALRGERLTVAPLASPGMALLLVAAALAWRTEGGWAWGGALRRSLRPIGTVLVFVLLAQVMQETGLIALATAGLAAIPFALAVPLAPALAMLGGYATGSAVAGNALFMPAVAELGAAHGYAFLFAAIQNAGAGMAAFASFPILALASAIARGQGQVPGAREADLARFALRSLLLVYAALAAGFVTLIALP